MAMPPSTKRNTRIKVIPTKIRNVLLTHKGDAVAPPSRVKNLSLSFAADCWC